MILETKNLCRSYRKEPVLKDVTMGLKQGEILGIVGESGCGKSTLARHLCCYDRPTSGKVIFKGQDTSIFGKEGMKDFRRSCQLILQDNLSSLDPTMTVGDSLREVLRYNSSLRKEQMDTCVKEMVERVFLDSSCLEKRPSQLSGGERQRINIARALLIRPQILICDEITSSLDVIIQNSIMKLLIKLREEMGLSIIFISHDIKAVKNVSNRILVMHNGMVCEQLKREDDFQGNNLYTEELLNSLPIDHPSKRNSIR